MVPRCPLQISKDSIGAEDLFSTSVIFAPHQRICSPPLKLFQLAPMQLSAYGAPEKGRAKGEHDWRTHAGLAIDKAKSRL